MALFIGKQSGDASVHVELDDSFVTQTVGILAQRRKGKTYTASVIAEQMMKAKIPFVVLDPTSAWWGLRASADGVGPGLPVTILGGAHGDVPIERGDGAAIAELVIEAPGYYVIDFGGFESGAAEKQFATDFALRLYRRKGQPGADFPLHLFIDEADRFVPQRIRDKADTDERLLGAIETIVKRGGIRGLGTTLISQRAAVVNKNVLEQLDVLIVLRVVGPNDQKAIKGYVQAAGTPEQVTELMGSLASLEIGECWLWEPGEDVFQRVKIRQRATFNSSATPKPGETRIEPKQLAPVDLEAVKARLTETIEKARADDPVVLRKRIRELEIGLQEQTLTAENMRSAVEVSAANAKPQIVEVPVGPDPKDIERLDNAITRSVAAFIAASEKQADQIAAGHQRLIEAGNEASRVFMESMNSVSSILARTGVDVGHFQEQIRLLGGGTAGNGPGSMGPSFRGAPTSKRAASSHGGSGHSRAEERPDPPRVGGAGRPTVSGTEDAPLKKGARRMLQALASVHPAKLTRLQLGFFANMSATSGTFSDYMSLLRVRGYLNEDEEGLVGPSVAGLDFLGGDVPPRMTTDQLVATAAAKLKAGARRMFLELVKAYPDPVSREYLAIRSEISATSGTFSDYLSILRRAALMTDVDRQNVRASDALFRIGA